jgi:3-isopropylmalate/(R)-2-methylmalate dehydratase small subunit
VEDSKRVAISGKAVAVAGNDIDTDRIIPARFLRCVTFDGLGAHAFEDDRKQLAERGQRHPFDEPARQSAEVLVVGRNFGCGSSREHAPAALMRWGKGLKAIVGESFAEIFFGNCTANGVPCLQAAPVDVARLIAAVQADADLDVQVDVAKQEVRFGGQTIAARIPDGAREQLLSGRWDTTGELLADPAQIAKTVAALPYFRGFV